VKSCLNRAVIGLAALALVGCESMNMGSQKAKTVATGAAGGENVHNSSAQLAHCDSSLGTVSLVENQTAGWYTILTQEYRLPPTAQLLRLMIQQSNCFLVVERSATGMQAMQRERALMGTGELRGGSNMGGGQMVAADYSLSPEIILNQRGTSGAGGGLGGTIGGVLGLLVGNITSSDASVMLTLVDNRSGVQVSVSEGSARNTDFGGLLGLFGSSGGASVGAYNRTPEGKVITAAFMDGYNNMVNSLRNYRAQAVSGQGLGGGGRLGVEGSAAPSYTSASTGSVMSVQAAQQRLNALGYDAGVADGSMRPKTVQALRDFQRARNLPQTGRIDSVTSQALQ